MGAKSSKKTLGSTRLVWAAENDEWDVSVANLERSTMEDRRKNSLGLPEDLLAAMVSNHLEVWDFGVVARVCKTWRRIVSKPTLWRSVAARMNLDIPRGRDVDVRAEVILSLPLRRIPIDFMLLPCDVRSLRLPKQDVALCSVALLSCPDDPWNQDGVGKSWLYHCTTNQPLENDRTPKGLLMGNKSFDLDFGAQGKIQCYVTLYDISCPEELEDDNHQWAAPWVKLCNSVIVAGSWRDEESLERLNRMMNWIESVTGGRVPTVIAITKDDLGGGLASGLRSKCKREGYALISCSRDRPKSYGRVVEIAAALALDQLSMVSQETLFQALPALANH